MTESDLKRAEAILGDMGDLSLHDEEVLTFVRKWLNDAHINPELLFLNTTWKPHEIPPMVREAIVRLDAAVKQIRFPWTERNADYESL